MIVSGILYRYTSCHRQSMLTSFWFSTSSFFSFFSFTLFFFFFFFEKRKTLTTHILHNEIFLCNKFTKLFFGCFFFYYIFMDITRIWVLSFNRITCMNQTTTYVYTDYLVLLTAVCGCTPEGRGNGSNGPRIAYYQNDKLLSMLIQNILCWLLGKSHCWSWEDCG